MAVPSPSPSTSPITTADDAIAAVQKQFPQMQKVKRSEPGTIGASTDITVLERPDGWDLVFWQGWDDCPAGCINNRYDYFSVERNGRIAQVGEYTRIFDSSKNSFDVTGSPMWGIPKTP